MFGRARDGRRDCRARARRGAADRTSQFAHQPLETPRLILLFAHILRGVCDCNSFVNWSSPHYFPLFFAHSPSLTRRLVLPRAPLYPHPSSSKLAHQPLKTQQIILVFTTRFKRGVRLQQLATTHPSSIPPATRLRPCCSHALTAASESPTRPKKTGTIFSCERGRTMCTRSMALPPVHAAVPYVHPVQEGWHSLPVNAAAPRTHLGPQVTGRLPERYVQAALSPACRTFPGAPTPSPGLGGVTVCNSISLTHQASIGLEMQIEHDSCRGFCTHQRVALSSGAQQWRWEHAAVAATGL